MIQDLAPKVYHNEYYEKQPQGHEWALLYRGRECLLKQQEDGKITFPKVSDLSGESIQWQYLFRIDEEEFFLGWPADRHGKERAVLGQDADAATAGGTLEALFTEGYAYTIPWIFRAAEPRYLAYAGITGWQLCDWYDSRKYCGSCGSRTVRDHKERMIKCPKCGRMYYPTICPAVIVAVTHNGKILMSKYRDREYKRFALIAGFNETGETIEETVRREVMEEVGLPVKNLRFYKSQPWPFSDSLLMGFFCELDSEDETITLDREELSEAGWYTPDEVPDNKDNCSLTHEMMIVFREGRVQECCR